MRRPRISALVPAAVLAILVGWPVATMLSAHLRPGDLVDVVADAGLRDVLLFTTRLAVTSTVAILVVGLPAAWSLERHVFPGSRVLAAAVSVPFVMPAVVVAAGVLAIAPGRGLGAIVWAHVVFNVAVVVRVVGPAWRLVPRDEIDAAASLGAGPLARSARVTWPHLRESVHAAASLVFVFSFTTYGAVAVLGDPSTRTVETEVFARAVRLDDARTAVALSVAQVLVVALVLLAGRARTSGSPVGSGTPVVPSGRLARVLVPAVGAASATVVAAPLVAVVLRSFRLRGEWTIAGWRSLVDGTLDAVGIDVAAVVARSALFAACAGSLALLLALLAVRTDRRGAVETISLATIVVSPVMLGLGMVLAFDADPVDWRGATWLLPAVHALVALPLAVRIVGPSLRAIDPALVDAATDLGAGRLRTWTAVRLPLVRPAVVRAWAMGAAVSLGEFGATSFLSRSGSMTVPVAIASLTGRAGPVLQQAGFALSALVVIVVVAAASSVA